MEVGDLILHESNPRLLAVVTRIPTPERPHDEAEIVWCNSGVVYKKYRYSQLLSLFRVVSNDEVG